MKRSFCLARDLRTVTFLSQGDASNVCVGRGCDARLNKKGGSLVQENTSLYSVLSYERWLISAPHTHDMASTHPAQTNTASSSSSSSVASMSIFRSRAAQWKWWLKRGISLSADAAHTAKGGLNMEGQISWTTHCWATSVIAKFNGNRIFYSAKTTQWQEKHGRKGITSHCTANSPKEARQQAAAKQMSMNAATVAVFHQRYMAFGIVQ